MNTTTTIAFNWQRRADALAIDGRAFVDGRRVPASGQLSRATISPIDGRILADVAACGPSDVDTAVSCRAARFPVLVPQGCREAQGSVARPGRADGASS